MAIQIIDSLDKNTYEGIIDILCSECDAITFNIPNYNKDFSKSKNIDSATNFIGQNALTTVNYYTKCIMNAKESLKAIESSQISMFFDVEYAGYKSIYLNQVFVYKIDDCVKDYLKRSNNFFDWKFPNFAEDVCFYSKGICRLRTVAHEELLLIFNESAKLMKYIKNKKIMFTCIIDERIKLKYTL